MPRQLFLIIAALAIITILSGGITYLVLTKKTSHQAVPTPTLTPAISPAPAKYTVNLETIVRHQGTNADVEIWLDPKNQNLNLSTISLEVEANSNGNYVIPRNSSPLIDDNFKTGGWTFPFANLVAEGDNKVILKMAALFVSTQPYPLNQKVLVATIPLRLANQDQKLIINVKPENSKAYTNTSELINFKAVTP